MPSVRTSPHSNAVVQVCQGDSRCCDRSCPQFSLGESAACSFDTTNLLKKAHGKDGFVNPTDFWFRLQTCIDEFGG